MTNKKKLHSILLVLITLIFIFLVSNSAVALAAQETRLSKDIGENGEPAIYGDKVVWSYWDKIHLYDLKTGNDTTISVPEHYNAAHPAIYDNRIVWYLCNDIDVENTSKLCVYDILTSTSSLITENVSQFPDIYGDRVVWAAERNYKTDIYMYNIPTYTQTKIPTNGSASSPAIYDNKIVWVSHGRNGTAIDKNNNSLSRSDIYMYDLSTKKETRISTSGRASNPAIYDDRIVWQDSRNLDFLTGMGDIYMYNLSTEKESRISYSEHSSPSSPPAIYGDRIVWEDHRNGFNIYMYNLSTQKEIRITTSECAMKPDIYGDIIVDMDNREGLPPGDGYFCDIYMYDLTVKPIKPQASFISNVTFGNTPLTVLFTDTSTGEALTSWYWDFGDGINSKHATNATHTFTNPGVYNVTLTVANEVGNSKVMKPNYITVTSPQTLIADFFSPQVDKARSNLDSVKNETLSFIDNSKGSPTSWLWDFGDGTISTAQNPTHAYTNEGGYTVTLTVKNAIGSNTASKYGYALVRMDDGGIIAPAYFSSNVTSGIVPLTVLFHDTTVPDVNGDYAYGRSWDFGDTTNYGDDYDENNSTYITHTYKKPGKYTVKLRSYDIGGGCIITKYNYITVIDPNAPVADFSASVTSGYAPLSVQFTDVSQNAISRSWDFGDGATSTEQNPSHIYSTAGTYTVNLMVSNENGTSPAKTATITVTEQSSPSHSSGGSGGGAGGSPEPAKNIEVKEISQAHVANGKPVKFDFTKNATCVVYVAFDAKKTAGKTTTIAEQLKGKSTQVSQLDSGEVYKYFNLWVGNSGFATSSNIGNPVVCFKVEKSWMQDKKIDQASITLNRYNDKKWSELPVTLSREDDKYVYFTAETPGFSYFAITGETVENESENAEKPETGTQAIKQNNTSSEIKQEQKPGQESEQGKQTSIPGFGTVCGIACLITAFRYNRR